MILLSATLPFRRPAKEAHFSLHPLFPLSICSGCACPPLEKYLSTHYSSVLVSPIGVHARIYTPPGTLAMGRGVTPFPPGGGATRMA